jgi:hypothetical protein
MSPSSPYGMHSMKACKFNDECYVGVVVVVGSTGYVDDDITHANVFSVGANDINELAFNEK